MFRSSGLRGLPSDCNPIGEDRMTIVGIIVVIILVLLAIYLFQRVR
jgi:hypothetical protein